jgi:hypothetical protein
LPARIAAWTSAPNTLLLDRCRLDQDGRHWLAASPGGLQAMYEIGAAGALDTLDQ